jgi:organic hydroperoxide reductase OsmC/OhrA
MSSTLSPQPTIDTTATFIVTLRLLNGYAFRADFEDTLVPLQTDEPPPLGKGNGPSPSRLLAVAVGNCLASSLLHCLRKARVEVRELDASVAATLARNEDGRLRIESLDVTLDPKLSPEQSDRLSRCTDLFEDYCVVTESVRHGIDVRVTVGNVGNVRTQGGST